jgi:hypothetical protein
MPHASGVVLVGPPASGKSDLARCLRARDVHVVDPRNFVEERTALATARAAVFVLGSTDGIDQATAYLWREVAAARLARAVVVTKLDDPRADFDETCALVQRLFDPHGCVPITLPVLDDEDHLAGFLDLWSGVIRHYVGETTRTMVSEQQHLELTEAARGRLRDTLSALDDSELADATTAGLITPILGFAAPGCIGSDEVTTVVEWLANAPDRQIDAPEWPAPVPGGMPSIHVTVTVPADYREDIDAYLRRIPDVRFTSESPGDGTVVFTVSGAAAHLERVPIHVHGLSDGTSTCRVLD